MRESSWWEVKALLFFGYLFIIDHHSHLYPIFYVVVVAVIIIILLTTPKLRAIPYHPFIILLANQFTKKATSVLKSRLLFLSIVIFLFVHIWRWWWWWWKCWRWLLRWEEKWRLRILSSVLFLNILEESSITTNAAIIWLLLILCLTHLILTGCKSSASDIHCHRI